MELSGEVRDRSVGVAELLQHTAPGRVRERGERSVEAGFVILNHIVQYIADRLAACKRVGAGYYQERWKPARVVRKGDFNPEADLFLRRPRILIGVISASRVLPKRGKR
jgi:hypothetical protein